MTVEFHRLEALRPCEVICSFKTGRHGILQIGYSRGGGKGYGVQQFTEEPSLDYFTEYEQLKIKSILRVVWRMVYDVPNVYAD